MKNCTECLQPDCRQACPELEASKVALGDAQKRILELEAKNKEYSAIWAKNNSELQTLKIWKNAVILTVTGEQTQ